MIDFPASPTVGQQFTAAGVTWTWDGHKWTASGLSVAYLPLAGGTMLGPIALSADPAAAMQPVTLQYFNARPMIGDNRIINGDMRIDQRNAGASGTVNGYTCDRWGFGSSPTGKGTWQRQTGGASTTTAFTGTPYFLNFTSNSAYVAAAADFYDFYQAIEADQVSDFAWGTPQAQPVTLSFWVYTSLTGTFSGSIRNFAGTRSYPFAYSIPAANTWTKLVINIPGDTGGLWTMTGNAGSMYLIFDLGSGANARGTANAWATTTAPGYTGVTGSQSIVAVNGASFTFTGVKLEIGSVATPYNRQSLAKSLADCQRYYQNSEILAAGYQIASQTPYCSTNFPVTMRAAPTLAILTNHCSNITTPALGSIQTSGLYLSGVLTATGTFVLDCVYSASAEI